MSIVWVAVVVLVAVVVRGCKLCSCIGVLGSTLHMHTASSHYH